VTFRQLEYICTLVQEGSISNAAKKLCISQPALSKQIAHIENEFQIQIIDRSTNPVTLTDDGALYYDAAKKNAENQGAARTRLGQRKSTA
jgi:DNA-binding transcriptional LysR family regulator